MWPRPRDIELDAVRTDIHVRRPDGFTQATMCGIAHAVVDIVGRVHNMNSLTVERSTGQESKE